MTDTATVICLIISVNDVLPPSEFVWDWLVCLPVYVSAELDYYSQYYWRIWIEYHGLDWFNYILRTIRI